MSNLIPDDIARFGWLRPGSSLGRARLGLLASLTVLTGAAWALTVYQALSMSAPMEGMSDMAMSGVPGTGWSFASAVVFLGVWTVMMAAMMLPATAPMILVFASAQAQHEGRTVVPTWIFVAGYLLVWMAVGAVVYVLSQVLSDIANLLRRRISSAGSRLRSELRLSQPDSISSRHSNESASAIAALRLPSWHSTGATEDSAHLRWVFGTAPIASAAAGHFLRCLSPLGS